MVAVATAFASFGSVITFNTYWHDNRVLAVGLFFAVNRMSEPVDDVPIVPILMGCETQLLQPGAEAPPQNEPPERTHSESEAVEQQGRLRSF